MKPSQFIEEIYEKLRQHSEESEEAGKYFYFVKKSKNEKRYKKDPYVVSCQLLRKIEKGRKLEKGMDWERESYVERKKNVNRRDSEQKI